MGLGCVLSVWLIWTCHSRVLFLFHCHFPVVIRYIVYGNVFYAGVCFTEVRHDVVLVRDRESSPARCLLFFSVVFVFFLHVTRVGVGRSLSCFLSQGVVLLPLSDALVYFSSF